MIVVIDNYDSFVHNLARYIRLAGAETPVETAVETFVVRNDAVTVAEVLDKNPSGIVISPGPCGPAEAGISVDVIRAAAERDIPVLGVCLGHPCLAVAFGGRVVRSSAPMHGRSSLLHHTGTGILQGISSPCRVGRYHALVVDVADVPDMVVTSRSDEGEVMAIHHQHLPAFGVQFHPESILTEQGHQMIRNFVEICYA